MSHSFSLRNLIINVEKKCEKSILKALLETTEKLHFKDNSYYTIVYVLDHSLNAQLIS